MPTGYAGWASVGSMSTQQHPSPLGDEGGEDGSFRRQESTFRNAVSADGSTDFPLQAGRYHLYAARACPWAHRTLIGRELMGLQNAIGVSFVSPLRDERGWEFAGGEHTDAVNGFRFLSEAYAIADPIYDARVTVPVLWDTQSATIVNNESADILRMLSTVFHELAEHPIELYPERLRGEIDALNQTIYDSVNNAVYKAGFATRQAVYEREVRELFATLDALDARLADCRFLFGPEPLETDWRLFTTLVRFDAVYQIHFKCSVRKLVEYANLWPCARDLYQWPGVVPTVDFDEIRAHYYRTHPMINPSGMIAVQPAAAFGEPAGRT
jgi:putative glutathione S-transferase